MKQLFEAFKKRAQSPWFFLGALLCVGAVLRVMVNDVAAYTPADETHYVDITRWLTREGLSAYPKFVSTYLEKQAMWLSPTPLRWGYFSFTTLVCSVHAPCDGRAIAWLSTLAGVASLVFTYLLGQRLVGRTAALLATALSIVSPLQLALGRHALPDSVYCAAFLTAFWSFTRLFDTEAETSTRAMRHRWAGFIATATLAFSIKEAFVFPYAAFVLLYLFGETKGTTKLRRVGLFLVPPLLFCAGFLLLGKNLTALRDVTRLQEASFSSDYGIRSTSEHQPLVDLFFLAPIVGLSATAALAKMTERLRDRGGERWLAAFLVLTLVTFMGLPKNLRFVVVLDPILRLLAAWLLVNHAWFGRASSTGRTIGAGLFLIVDAMVEWTLFDSVFRQRNVYDPTTHDILRALGAIPGSLVPTTSIAWLLVIFLASGGTGAVVVGGWRAIMTEKGESAEKSSILHPRGLVALGAAALWAAYLLGRWSAPAATPTPLATTGQAAMPNAGVVTTNLPVPGQTARDPMTEGLDALYKRKDPVAAAARFREVLTKDPNHYGATYQLATALEQSGDNLGARTMWTKMVGLSENIHDEATLGHAKARLAALPQPAPQDATPPDPNAEQMRLGIAALYEKNHPVEAAKHFREVLAKNPSHYGATFQLATALEKSGKRDDAKPLWKKTLEMAEAINDTQTAAIARKYLGKTVGVFGAF